MNSIKRPFPPPRHGRGRRLIAIAGAVVVAAVAGWLLLGSTITGGGEDEPERYREATVGTAERVNPLFAHFNDVDRDLSALIFSGLTRLGPDGQVEPDLAESWRVSADGRSVTFTLRTDVVWHTGGTRVNAEDVVFTYNLLADPRLQGDPDQAPLWRQVHCEAPSSRTVECLLPTAFAPFLAFTTVGILPRHILGGVDTEALFDNPFNRNPVGSGPFRLVELDTSHVLLAANASYHLGAPTIDEVEFKFYPDLATASAAVLGGDADGILLPGSAAGGDEHAELAASDALARHVVTPTAYAILYLNNGKRPLNDVAVRRAVAAAVDIDGIVGEALGGSGAVATSPIAPATWAHNPDIQPYEHDDGEARRLLEDAGWKVPERSNVRVRADQELRFTLLTDLDPVRAMIGERIAAELEEVGIGVTVEHEESTSLVRDFLIPRDYDAAIFGFDPGSDPDPYPAWHSSQVVEEGRNIAGYRNDAADRLMEQGRRTYDAGERAGYYYEFQRIFHNDVGSVLLYYTVYTYFVRRHIGGIELGTLFNTGSRFQNVHEWRFQESVVIGD